jgi:hypothetical protein
VTKLIMILIHAEMAYQFKMSRERILQFCSSSFVVCVKGSARIERD